MHKFFAKTRFIGKKVIFLPQCHSTNEIAMSLVNNRHASEGLIVMAADQTHGRGQRGNTWQSDAGKNLTYSIVLQPRSLHISHQFRLHQMISLAVHEALSPILPPGLKVKWPNDIYYGDKKIGGILIENTLRGAQIDYAIIGIGINVNQEHFTLDKATSLAKVRQTTFDIDQIAEDILIAMEELYEPLSGPLANLAAKYEQILYRIHETHRYQAEGKIFHGQITGIAPDGKLMIEEKGNVHHFDFKEVSFI